jgi:hypothetical protein
MTSNVVNSLLRKYFGVHMILNYVRTSVVLLLAYGDHRCSLSSSDNKHSACLSFSGKREHCRGNGNPAGSS